MKYNSCSTLSLLLSLVLLPLGYTWGPVHKKERSNSEFDYFRLVFRWPNSFCNVPDGNCKPPVPDYFTLHGLWPQKDNGDPLEYCSKTTMPDKILDDLKDDLVNIWPDLRAMNWKESKDFYKEQWRKHGTCSESVLGPKEYLETALNLGGGNDLYDMLKKNKPAIVPDPKKLYLTDDIRNAVNKGAKKWPDVYCNTRPTQHGNEYQLFEIHLCYKFDESKNLIKINCDGQVYCSGEKQAYYPNTYKTVLSDVPSEKELVPELEDSAEL